jgi:tRNA pseudouridine38-40 synthase
MPQRLKLIVAYDGAAFAGWQSQLHGNTIQDALERAVHKLCAKSVRVHGAGRTDAGVHALAQCAHVDLPDRRMPAKRWLSAVNGILPATIRILRARFVTDEFHARFSAKGKVYRYRIWAGPVLPPLEFQRAWHVSAPLDLNALNAANRGKSTKRTDATTVHTIRSVRVRRRGECITLEFDGDGFLYKMVRLMVGGIVRVGLGKLSLKTLSEQLSSGRASGTRFVAPAEGLFLVRVWY